MKKHYKSYTAGGPDGFGSFDGAKELRIRLMEAKNAGEVKKIIQSFLKSLP
jgi:hypothetical protein